MAVTSEAGDIPIEMYHVQPAKFSMKLRSAILFKIDKMDAEKINCLIVCG
jgi:hypothetical protein